MVDQRERPVPWRRLVPVPGHLPSPVRRLPVDRTLDRIGWRPGYGVDSGGPADPVVIPGLSGQHQPVRPEPSDRGMATGVPEQRRRRPKRRPDARPPAPRQTRRERIQHQCPAVGKERAPGPPPPKASALGISVLNNDGSIDGEFSNQDRLTAIDGRLANPNRANEVVVSTIVAQALGLHVGEVVPFGFYTNDQTMLPGYGNGSGLFKVRAHLQLGMKVVGIVAFNNQVVLDSLDQTATAQIVYTPTLTRRLVQCCITSTTSFLQLDHGTGDVSAVEQEIERVAGPNGPVLFGVKSNPDTAERAIKPESIALGVFGAIAALAALLIAGQAISRQLRFGADDERTLRALGAGPAMTLGDSLLGLLIAVVAGSLLAVAVAIGLSPLAPIGVVRPVYPYRGVTFDWTVLGLGPVVFVAVLGALSVLIAYRHAPHRVDSQGNGGSIRQIGRDPRRSRIRATRAGGGGHPFRPRPRDWAQLCARALSHRRSDPRHLGRYGDGHLWIQPRPAGHRSPLYGWNWNYELTGGGGIAPVPGQQAANLLDRDRSVVAWSAVSFGGTVSMGGQVVPVLGQSPHASVAPPVLSGHGLDASDEVVLGGATLSALHKQVGDAVELDIPGSKPTRLHIVGTATMPTIGVQIGGQHPTMGTGALVTSTLIPESVSNPNNVSPAGPDAVLVRVRSGANPETSLRALRQIADKLSLPENYGVTLLTVQRPAEIINYRSMGTIPALLGAGLAVGAVGALGLTLVASVRRRSHDLALLKTIGLTRRQLAATVAWQSSVAIGLGAALGVPLGIVLGRFLWDLFAREINAVPVPSVPGANDLLHCRRGIRPRQHRCRRTGAHRCQHSDRAFAAGRVTEYWKTVLNRVRSRVGVPSCKCLVPVDVWQEAFHHRTHA